MMMKYLVILLICAGLFCGCTTTQKGAGIGTLIGAGTGAIIGHQSGHAAEGALIGGAAGAAGGALIGDKAAVKFCPECGQDYTGKINFCTKCGVKLKLKK